VVINYGYNEVMVTVGMAEGKSQFLKLVRMAEAGERIVITRHGVPVAQLAPPPPAPGRARLGGMRGRIHLSPGCNEALDPERFPEGGI
jgi:prevent-host-death family protein